MARDPLSLHHHADRCPAGGKGGQGGHQLLQWALSMLHLATGRLLRSKSAQEYKRQPPSVYSGPGLPLHSAVFALGTVGMHDLTRTGDGGGGKEGSDS